MFGRTSLPANGKLQLCTVGEAAVTVVAKSVIFYIAVHGELSVSLG